MPPVILAAKAPPEVGKTVQAGALTAVCVKTEWRYVPHTLDEPVECHSREAAEACARAHGGHVSCRSTYETTWLARDRRNQATDTRRHQQQEASAMTTRSQMDAELQKLYDQIPRIPDCDGRCWTSCGPIGMSDRENQRIRQAGIKVTPYKVAMAKAERYWCEALTDGKRCAVYDMRPLVCRLWGAVEGLPCVYGCVPEGGYLSDAEGFRLIAESMRVGNGEPASPVAPEAVSEVMARDHIRAELERIRARGQAGERHRMDEHVPAAFRRRR